MSARIMEGGLGPCHCSNDGLANPGQIAPTVLAFHLGRLGPQTLATPGRHLDHAHEGHLAASPPKGY